MPTKHTSWYKKFLEIKIYLKKLKLGLNNIIDKTLTYASETEILTKRDRQQINMFGRNVYTRILGPVYEKEKKVQY
jgi:hypothetical protein